MPDVNLSIDLDALFVEPTELDGDPVNVRTAMRDAVVQAAATKLIAGFDYEELHEMRQEVQRVRSDLVRERLLAEVEAAFSEPVQRTTSWGEKLGEPSSLRELIRAELEAFLNNTNRRRRDTYDKPQSLAELIEIISRDVMSTTLRKSVSEVRAKVDAEVQKILVGAIAEKLAGVK
jgi:Asp-tRNA(Asn)/Glu-tRNA(Gln) amidotransferase B subunit